MPTQPTPTVSVSPSFGPGQQAPGNGAGAGLDAFLLVIALVAASAVLFVAMSRSLKRSRRNLGGSSLPRQQRDREPVDLRKRDR